MSGEAYAIIGGLIWIGMLTGVVFHLWVEVRSTQKSTHTVQYVDPFSKASNQDITEDIKKVFHQNTDMENIV